MRLGPILAFVFIATANAPAQWEIQSAPTTADLRGIDSEGQGIAWASGSQGTVLRTIDDGKTWQRCATPHGAEALDFRGIQAFDAKTAIVMSSGKGPLSRLYETTNACKSWKLILKNIDKQGFWDALVFQDKFFGMLLGDPVNGSFFLAETFGDHKHWIQQHNKALRADSASQGAFAASNSSMLVSGHASFGTGGVDGAFFYAATQTEICLDDCPDTELEGRNDAWLRSELPLGQNTESSGLFSLAWEPSTSQVIVAVGGDFQNPENATRTAAFTSDGGKSWLPAQTPPHGFRSAVAYDEATKTWITVGPNGTDVSGDDGRNWRALKPDPRDGDPPDGIPEDQHWNALSLPFVVGPHGRIGRLRSTALSEKNP
jgi:photosystem II stability/assembly factor-like uncharacterized protein